MVTYWGQNRLFHNRGDGRFEDVTARAGLKSAKTRWGAGCAFLDYDRDGRLDLFAANYIDFDPASTPVPESGLCRYKGIPVACGPPGLPGGRNVLYHNTGNGAFEDVSERAGITRASGTTGWVSARWISTAMAGSISTWRTTPIRARSISTTPTEPSRTSLSRPAAPIVRTENPRQEWALRSATTIAMAPFDLFKTKFAGDTSTLYANDGKGSCEDRTFAGGIGLNTRWLGWGVGFLDLDNDGWLDLFLVNGHVYPEVQRVQTEAGYKQRKIVYRNLANGRFEDVTERLGPPVTTPAAGRGAAFADLDNDGDIDVVVNNVHAEPNLFRLDSPAGAHWITLKLIGTRSNRRAIGARVRLFGSGGVQLQEVRGGGSYYSQNDLRVHFGLGRSAAMERLEIRWPNGLEEQWKSLEVDRIVTLTEGTGTAMPATK